MIVQEDFFPGSTSIASYTSTKQNYLLIGIFFIVISANTMLAALRSCARSSIALARCSSLQQPLDFHLPAFFSSSNSSLSSSLESHGHLSLEEVQKILNDVRADDVKVIPVKDKCGWTDFMVIATGRSTWHVKNIAQALVYKVCSFPYWFS